MSLQQFLLILRARLWIIGVALLVGVAGAVGANLVLPRLYTASATVVVDSRVTDAVTGASVPAPLMSTQLEIIRSQRVALRVVDATRIAQSPTAQQQFQAKTGGKGSIRHWWAERLLANTEVQPRRDSNLVDIRFTTSEPRFASLVANSFAKAYIDVTLELTLEPARQTATFFDDQLKGLRDNLEKAQGKLSEYQQKHGIVAPDQKLDVETTRLEELASRLTAAQGDARDSLTRQREATEFAARGGFAPEEVPDALSNPLIQ